MIQITDKYSCSGCTACASKCPKDAIKMEKDSLGFLYPKVNADLCINCGLCNQVCEFHSNYDKSYNLASPFFYAVRHKNNEELLKSRSGGVFAALSDYILEKGGIVYGVGYLKHFVVSHKKATTKSERDEFRGSKYVQSDLSDIFKQIKNDLNVNRIVLFSGTPCQTAGLRAFLGNKKNLNLYLIDIVCHGVVSPKIWKDYLSYLESKEKDQIISINFRDKNLFGWKDHQETFTFKHKGLRHYGYQFYHSNMYRMSCYRCPFANTIRPSDITIGDFWGWEKVNADFNADNKGCSLVICNTEKGKELFDNVKENVIFIPTEKEKALQPNLKNPSPLPKNRNQYEKDYFHHGFIYIKNKYGNVGWGNIIIKIKSFIKKIVL